MEGGVEIAGERRADGGFCTPNAKERRKRRIDHIGGYTLAWRRREAVRERHEHRRSSQRAGLLSKQAHSHVC